jgi:hypothetical protein
MQTKTGSGTTMSKPEKCQEKAWPQFEEHANADSSSPSQLTKQELPRVSTKAGLEIDSSTKAERSESLDRPKPQLRFKAQMQELDEKANPEQRICSTSGTIGTRREKTQIAHLGDSDSEFLSSPGSKTPDFESEERGATAQVLQNPRANVRFHPDEMMIYMVCLKIDIAYQRCPYTRRR